MQKDAFLSNIADDLQSSFMNDNSLVYSLVARSSSHGRHCGKDEQCAVQALGGRFGAKYGDL